jgi:transcriptional regulator with XRE-family HTH domain
MSSALTPQQKKIARRIAMYKEAVERAISSSRKKEGMSQQTAADQMGWSVDVMSNVEKGRREISVAEFIVLAEELGLSPETLFKRIRL